MSSDDLIRFEEDNWTELAEKFIAAHIDEWEVLVFQEWVDSARDYEPEYEPEKKLDGEL